MTCYPVHGKLKATNICTAFAEACGGRVSMRLQPGDAFFFGVNETNVEIWRAVCADRTRSFYYADNAYFDSARQLYFRITKNRLQHSGVGTTTGERLRAMGIQMRPWRDGGDYILLCPQSDSFMRNAVGGHTDWVPQVIKVLEHLTLREVRTRPWGADKSKLARSLDAELREAHALVTWSSAAAVTAVLAGVPIVTLGQCAAEPMAGSLTQIESLPRLDREEWAGVLADNQWTLPEIADGTAWRSLNA